MAVQLKQRYHIGEQVSSDLLIQVIDDFVTDTERRHIIGQAAGHLDTALVSTAGPSRESDGRTGSVAWIHHDRTPIVRGLVKRVSQLVGIPVRHAESLQVVHYAETEQYRPHFDAYDMNTEKGRQRTAKGGQRLVTALIYLNEVEDGGGTAFPKLDLEIEPRVGRMVIFHNIADPTVQDLTRHPLSQHGGSPVWGGEKWACNLWFRQRPYQVGPAAKRTGTAVGKVDNSTARAAAARRKQQRSKRAAPRR